MQTFRHIGEAIGAAMAYNAAHAALPPAPLPARRGRLVSLDHPDAVALDLKPYRFPGRRCTHCPGTLTSSRATGAWYVIDPARGLVRLDDPEHDLHRPADR